MIYFKNLIEIDKVNNLYRPINIDYDPFNIITGEGKTEEELRQSGIFLDKTQAQYLQEIEDFKLNNPVDLSKYTVETLLKKYVVPVPVDEGENIEEPQEQYYYDTYYRCIADEHAIETEQTLKTLGEELAQSKLENMQNKQIITNLGAELSKTKLDIINLQNQINQGGTV